MYRKNGFPATRFGSYCNCRCCLRHLEQSFAAPNSDNTHPHFIETINDTKRWVNNFPQMSDAKLRDNTAAFGKFGKSFHLGHHFSEQSLTHVRTLPIDVPRFDFLKILDRRDSKGD